MNPEIFSRNGKYLMLALDHRGSFKTFLNPENPEKVNSHDIIARKKEIITALSDIPSGVLIDIEYGLYAMRESRVVTPYLLAMEETGYEEEGSNRHTKVIHMASTIRAKGASGAKLLLYMHGDGSEGDRMQVVVAREALHNARIYSLPFFLEVVMYGATRKEVGERTLAAVRHLKKEKVEPSVWKLEYPGSPALCKEVTDTVAGVPWILLSRGVTFSQFTEEVGIASSAGAKGFLVGRSLWQDAVGGVEDVRARNLAALPERFKKLSEAMVH